MKLEYTVKDLINICDTILEQINKKLEINLNKSKDYYDKKEILIQQECKRLKTKWWWKNKSDDVIRHRAVKNVNDTYHSDVYQYYIDVLTGNKCKWERKKETLRNTISTTVWLTEEEFFDYAKILVPDNY